MDSQCFFSGSYKHRIELGWFAIFTPEKTEENPILIISMVEDVKGRGGSGYVVGKDKQVLESWLNRKE